jgi:mannosylfructose-phosphate synthase
MIEETGNISKVCMLSTHGYFDPVPELGKVDTGGQVLYVLNIARSLAKQGVEVDIYTRWFDPSKNQIETVPSSPGVRIIRIPAGGWDFVPKEHIYDLLPELSHNMIQFILDNDLDYDLFHGHYVDAGIVALDVADYFTKPVFFTAHSLGAWKKQRVEGDPKEMEIKYNFKHRIKEELRIFRSVNGQTVTSHEELEKIEELYHFKPTRVEFIPPGVDVQKFRPLKSGEKEVDLDTKLPHKFIFMASRTSMAKGHDLLLRAYVKVMEELNEVNLVFCGEIDCTDLEGIKVLSEIKNIVEKNELKKHVKLLGCIPNDLLPTFYRKSAIYVLPARFEPFGMAALEAMSCQVPVLISQYAGIQENLKDGKDFIKINPYDTQEFADKLIKLLNDEELSRTLAKNGRKAVLDNFSWEAIAQRLYEFYTTSN